jgi:hypothetical protein
MFLTQESDFSSLLLALRFRQVLENTGAYFNEHIAASACQRRGSIQIQLAQRPLHFIQGDFR